MQVHQYAVRRTPERHGCERKGGERAAVWRVAMPLTTSQGLTMPWWLNVCQACLQPTMALPDGMKATRG
jgi:hypothetical protein